MQITKLTITCTTGANRRPAGGWVTFDDGKEYSWGYLPDGTVSFSSYRRSHQGSAWQMFSFRSAARQAAVLAAFN